MKKAILSLAAALLLCLPLAPASVFAAESYNDVPESHWAYEAITAWSADEAAILRGYGDGNFGPDDTLKSSELDIIVARLLGADTPAWKPSEALTREAAAKVLAAALGLAPAAAPDALYSDDADIGEAYRPYVYALKDAGVWQGVGGGAFAPQSNFTRGQIVQTIHNAVSAIADADVGGKTYAKDLIVRRPDLTVKNTTVKGDLIVGNGVGEGDLTLDGVTVEGRLVAYGGGANSIVIRGSSRIAAIVTGKPNVHISLESGAKVQAIEIAADGVRVTVAKGAEVETLFIDAGGATVEGDGKLTNVTVRPEAVGAIVKTPNTIIVNESEGYVTTETGVVKKGETVTNPAVGGNGNTGGSGGGNTGGNNGENDPPAQRTVSVSAAAELAQLLKSEPKDVRIEVTTSMALTAALVGAYAPFDVSLLSVDGNSVLYVPEGVKLQISGTSAQRLSLSLPSAEIDGTVSLIYAAFEVNKSLAVDGAITTSDNSDYLSVEHDTQIAGEGQIIKDIGVLPQTSYAYGYVLHWQSGKWQGEITVAHPTDFARLQDAANDNIAEIRIKRTEIHVTSPITLACSRRFQIQQDGVLSVAGGGSVVFDTEVLVAGEIKGADGGSVTIKAGKRIKNVLADGGLTSDENGTGVLNGLPVDVQSADRTFVWTGGAWTLAE